MSDPRNRDGFALTLDFACACRKKWSRDGAYLAGAMSGVLEAHSLLV